MIYDIVDSNELLEKIRNINKWIRENYLYVGNANMYEIMSCLIARNNIKSLEGENEEIEKEIEKMLTLRKQSISELFMYVPETEELFNKIKDGFSPDSKEEMELICKVQSIAFYINNTHLRGYSGDITESKQLQEEIAKPNMQYENIYELKDIKKKYKHSSDDVKEMIYPSINWIEENTIKQFRSKIKPLNNHNTHSI